MTDEALEMLKELGEKIAAVENNSGASTKATTAGKSISLPLSKRIGKNDEEAGIQKNIDDSRQDQPIAATDEEIDQMAERFLKQMIGDYF
jgi:hypothetical protein